MDRRSFLKTGSAAALGAGVLPFLKSLPADAAGPDGTIVVVTQETINSMDIHRAGTNRPSYMNAVNLYDRLLSFGTKTLADGSLSYDYQKLEGEVAESWEVAKDGLSITFKLKALKFWDGSPITADDVKWSFDRAVSVGGFPTTQMKAGALEKPEQFEVVDAKTFRIKLLRPSKLTLPDLAVPVPIIINAKVAKANATEKDPWATEYLHRTPQGSGAFKLERWDPGQQVVYARNDDWKAGPLPAASRVIIREVPSQSTRRALIEKGDVGVSFNIPHKDAKELAAGGKVKVVGTPIENCFYLVGLNYNFEPFKDKKVRQAVAWAVPYEEIFKAAAYERGVKLWGGASAKPADIAWPQPFPYTTNIDKAKELLGQTAFKGGFEVPISIDLGLADWTEPTALLLQEGLAKIGIKTTIDKIPGANWRQASLIDKKLPLHLENFGGWLNYPCYYFYWCYIKGNLFNSSNYDNPEIAKLVAETIDMAVENPDYVPKIKRMIEIAFDEVPRIPLWQPVLDVALSPKVDGYEYWFHRQLDARGLKAV